MRLAVVERAAVLQLSLPGWRHTGGAVPGRPSAEPAEECVFAISVFEYYRSKSRM